jgi:RNA-directed DNA polymerase
MRVQENKGAPGIDGMTVEELPRYLKKNWPKHREELLEGTYKPKPARRKEIPKPDGGKRDLSIPCVLDRMIQQAMLQVCKSGGTRPFPSTAMDFDRGDRSVKRWHERKSTLRKATGSWWISIWEWRSGWS